METLELIARIGYFGLLMLALAAIVRGIMLGREFDRLGSQLQSPILYAVFLLALLLSFVQAYQSVSLILGRFNPRSWFIPFFCKPCSIVLYHIIFSHLRWQIGRDIERAAAAQGNTTPKGACQ